MYPWRLWCFVLPALAPRTPKWYVYPRLRTTAIDSKCKKFALKSRCTPLDSTKNLTTFRETYSCGLYIIFFICYSRFACCKDRGLHFYVIGIRDRNVDLPIDSKCKKFALKSRCTPLDSTKNLTSFRVTYSDDFGIIFFVCYSRFVCCKDRGLHFHVNDIRNRNVNLPIDSKCKNFALKSRCTPFDSTKSLTSFRYSGFTFSH